MVLLQAGAVAPGAVLVDELRFYKLPMNDSLARLLQDLGWLFCGVDGTIPLFWLLVHPFADYWRKRHRSPLPLLGLCWTLIWALAWLVSYPWRNALLYDWRWAWWMVIPLWTAAAILYGAAGRSLTLLRIIGRAEVEPGRRENQLISAGIHGRVRHPIYLGHLCAMLGWSIGTGSIACWSLTAFAVLTGAIMIPLEERELEERFGEPYRQYRRQVPMIVPRLK